MIFILFPQQKMGSNAGGCHLRSDVGTPNPGKECHFGVTRAPPPPPPPPPPPKPAPKGAKNLLVIVTDDFRYLHEQLISFIKFKNMPSGQIISRDLICVESMMPFFRHHPYCLCPLFHHIQCKPKLKHLNEQSA